MLQIMPPARKSRRLFCACKRGMHAMQKRVVCVFSKNCKTDQAEKMFF